MKRDHDARRLAQVDGANVPENPLNSARMSMLAHGFTQTDPQDPDHWIADANPWIRPDVGGSWSRLDLVAGLIFVAAMIVLVVIAV